MPDSVCMQVWRIPREPEKASRGAQHASKVVIKYSYSSYTYDWSSCLPWAQCLSYSSPSL